MATTRHRCSRGSRSHDRRNSRARRTYTNVTAGRFSIFFPYRVCAAAVGFARKNHKRAHETFVAVISDLTDRSVSSTLSGFFVGRNGARVAMYRNSAVEEMGGRGVFCKRSPRTVGRAFVIIGFLFTRVSRSWTTPRKIIIIVYKCDLTSFTNT